MTTFINNINLEQEKLIFDFQKKEDFKMELKEFELDIQETKEFFFKAMIRGWVDSGEKKIYQPRSFQKETPFSGRIGTKNFFLLDSYLSTPIGPKSAGATTIWCDDMPVWFMSYGGFYSKQVIPLVKEALLIAYKARQFHGGRGISFFQSKDKEFTYVNNSSGTFEKFEGFEKVYDTGCGDLLGFHKYWGMSLI